MQLFKGGGTDRSDTRDGSSGRASRSFERSLSRVRDGERKAQCLEARCTLPSLAGEYERKKKGNAQCESIVSKAK